MEQEHGDNANFAFTFQFDDKIYLQILFTTFHIPEITNTPAAQNSKVTVGNLT